ncbi:MAG: hypothetical protein MHMPM18_001429 [Marteilia pararefringens]
MQSMRNLKILLQNLPGNLTKVDDMAQFDSGLCEILPVENAKIVLKEIRPDETIYIVTYYEVCAYKKI